MSQEQVCPLRLMATMMTQQREDPALTNCVENRCAWYDPRSEGCAMLAIAVSLGSPSNKQDTGQV